MSKTPLKIHLDVNFPGSDRIEHDPTDLTLCGMGDKDSPLTTTDPAEVTCRACQRSKVTCRACQRSKVTCRACQRSKVFRAKFPEYSLPPTDAEVQRSRKWLKAS